MTQILDLLSGRKDKKAEPETPQALDRLSAMLTVGTPAGEAPGVEPDESSATLTVGTPAGEVPGVDTELASEPAPDDFVASQPDGNAFQSDDSASQGDESVFQADDSASQGDESVFQSDDSASRADESVFQADDSASQADAGQGVSSLFLPNPTEAPDTHAADDGVGNPMEPPAAMGAVEVADIDTADTAEGGAGDPMEPLAAMGAVEVADTDTAAGGVGAMETLAAVSAIEDAVRAAQQRAESQLTALVERVRKVESEHAAELARVTETSDQRVEQALTEARVGAETEVASLRDELGRRHAAQLEEVQGQMQREVTAAVEAALSERNRDHAAELASIREDVERQQADSLQRVGTAVLESLERLTERMITVP